MISMNITCDKCGFTASLMSGFERYNNGFVGFKMPDDWMLIGNKVICASCLHKLAEEELNKDDQTEN